WSGKKWVIWVKEWVYEKMVRVKLEKQNVVMYGDGIGEMVGGGETLTHGRRYSSLKRSFDFDMEVGRNAGDEVVTVEGMRRGGGGSRASSSSSRKQSRERDLRHSNVQDKETQRNVKYHPRNIIGHGRVGGIGRSAYSLPNNPTCASS
ncbi:pectinesterase inhibitor domain containing protein, partial [Tanacetum coccineum]